MRCSSRRTSSRVSTVGSRAGRCALLQLVQPRQGCLQHLAIQEQQRRQRLVLRGGSDIALARDVVEERGHLRRAHLPRVALPEKMYKAPDPMHVALFRAQAVVPPPDRITHALE